MLNSRKKLVNAMLGLKVPKEEKKSLLGVKRLIKLVGGLLILKLGTVGSDGLIMIITKMSSKEILAGN